MCLLVIRSVMFFFANHSQNRNVNIRLVFLKEVAYSILPILLQAICKNICLLQNILKRSYSLNKKFLEHLKNYPNRAGIPISLSNENLSDTLRVLWKVA